MSNVLQEEMPKGGDERAGLLCALTVFGWVPLSCGCPSGISVYPGCALVLLHLLLHTLSWALLHERVVFKAYFSSGLGGGKLNLFRAIM
jgi:hypothetical protein